MDNSELDRDVNRERQICAPKRFAAKVEALITSARRSINQIRTAGKCMDTHYTSNQTKTELYIAIMSQAIESEGHMAETIGRVFTFSIIIVIT